MSQQDDVLRSDFDLDFTYTRTYGPVMSQFFTELKDKNVLGIKASDGKVICPPIEYDPKTAEELNDFVQLGDSGTIKTWSWVNTPLDKHPLKTPFAWALIELEGADTAMLHAVDADKSLLATGAKVKIRWAEERVGCINDIACFELA